MHSYEGEDDHSKGLSHCHEAKCRVTFQRERVKEDPDRERGPRDTARNAKEGDSVQVVTEATLSQPAPDSAEMEGNRVGCT